MSLRHTMVAAAAVIALTGCGQEPATSEVDADATSGQPDVVMDAGADAGPTSVHSELQAATTQAVAELNIPGAAMGVAFSDGTVWTAAAGDANRADGEAWTAEQVFRIGSVSKTFTAALILLLVEDGTLTLDDPIEDWVPGYYDGLGVTVRHLMANGSGIVSYNYVGSFDRTRSWTPQELVAWAVANEPGLRFAPGTEWEYSNTNWVLLGLIAEAAGGSTFETQVEQRLTGPLGLTQTRMTASGENVPGLVSCYDEEGVDITATVDPSYGWAAGGMVSTPAELAQWGLALYGGEVLSAASLTLMTTPWIEPEGMGAEYGLGVFIESDGTQTIWGHTGGIGGYMTYMYHWVGDGITLVAMSNKLGTKLRDLAGYGWVVALDLP